MGRKRLLKSLIASILVALAITLFLAEAANATTPTLGEVRVLTAVNAERTKRDLVPLRFRSSLIDAARYHSADMARRNLLTHLSSCGWTTPQRLRAFGYTSAGAVYWKVGECIGRGYAGTVWRTPEGMVALWMSSPTHRDIILNKVFRDFGCGMRWNGAGTWRYFTADFGRRIY